MQTGAIIAAIFVALLVIAAVWYWYRQRQVDPNSGITGGNGRTNGAGGNKSNTGSNPGTAAANDMPPAPQIQQITLTTDQISRGCRVQNGQVICEREFALHPVHVSAAPGQSVPLVPGENADQLGSPMGSVGNQATMAEIHAEAPMSDDMVEERDRVLAGMRDSFKGASEPLMGGYMDNYRPITQESMRMSEAAIRARTQIDSNLGKKKASIRGLTGGLWPSPPRDTGRNPNAGLLVFNRSAVFTPPESSTTISVGAPPPAENVVMDPTF